MGTRDADTATHTDRGVYDIRHPYNDTTPPGFFSDYLNQGWVQNALGGKFLSLRFSEFLTRPTLSKQNHQPLANRPQTI